MHGFFGVLAGLILALFVTVFAVDYAEIDYVCQDTSEIYALNDNTSVSGRFFLGSGYVEEEMMYYYIEDSEYGKQTNSVPADNTHIIESNKETPRIEKYSTQYKSKFLQWFAFPPGEDMHKIYIPENSITTDFNVDLGNGSNTDSSHSVTPQKQCSACDALIDDADRFCPSCGEEITVSRFCTDCGEELAADDKFCGACGSETGRAGQ